jgi:hypothetical protein
MRKKIAIALTAGIAAATIGFGAASTASAAPQNAGAACVQEGLGFLKSQGLLKAAAQKKIDYSILGPNSGVEGFEGLMTVDLPVGSNLSLGQVVKYHTTNPEFFTWCA